MRQSSTELKWIASSLVSVWNGILAGTVVSHRPEPHWLSRVYRLQWAISVSRRSKHTVPSQSSVSLAISHQVASSQIQWETNPKFFFSIYIQVSFRRRKRYSIWRRPSTKKIQNILKDRVQALWWDTLFRTRGAERARWGKALILPNRRTRPHSPWDCQTNPTRGAGLFRRILICLWKTSNR